MQVKQFTGPLSGPLSLGLNNRKIVQIGIERPQSIPISESGAPKIVLFINGTTYALGEKDILEFENLYSNDVEIIVQDASPYLIIDIAYE